jgi:hypothetical protein
MARLGGFREREFFELEDQADAKVPDIDLSSPPAST